MLHVIDFADVRKFGLELGDVEIRADEIRRGKLATVHGVDVYVNRHVDRGSFWGYFEPYFFVGSRLPPPPSLIACDQKHHVIPKYGLVPFQKDT